VNRLRSVANAPSNAWREIVIGPMPRMSSTGDSSIARIDIACSRSGSRSARSSRCGSTNLLAGAKNLATTHIANGAYRLHPVEWNIGEAAGHLAALCAERGTVPRAVRADPHALADLQREIVRTGFELAWPDVRPY
jgi:FAD dependent oxidoreductase